MHIKNLKKLKLNNQNGIGLIEVMAAFSISVVVITSLVSLALYTVRSSLNSKLLLEGTKIASREIERVRGYRDASATWDAFIAGVSTGADCTCASAPCIKKCYMATPALVPTLGLTTETVDNQVMTRYFNVITDAYNPANIVRINVFVSWSIGGQTKGTQVYTDLTNWQVK